MCSSVEDSEEVEKLATQGIHVNQILESFESHPIVMYSTEPQKNGDKAVFSLAELCFCLDSCLDQISKSP